MATLADINTTVTAIATDVANITAAHQPGQVTVAQTDLDSLAANLANVQAQLAALLPAPVVTEGSAA